MFIVLNNAGNVSIQIIFPAGLYNACPVLNSEYKMNMYLCICVGHGVVPTGLALIFLYMLPISCPYGTYPFVFAGINCDHYWIKSSLLRLLPICTYGFCLNCCFPDAIDISSLRDLFDCYLLATIVSHKRGSVLYRLPYYILNTPYFVSDHFLFIDIAMPIAIMRRVSAGSIMPSSQSRAVL